jgi:hypothetical protein
VADTALARAKARLDALDLYPRPVRIDRVRIVVWPWFFKLPWFNRFDGHAAWNLIVLREPIGSSLGDRINPVPETDSQDDLLTHELCHVWQMQHKPIGMPLSYLRGYSQNPYELEARDAVARTSRS